MQQGIQLTVVGKIYFYSTPLWNQKNQCKVWKTEKKNKKKIFPLQRSRIMNWIMMNIWQIK